MYTKPYFVYILTNELMTVLYTGVTNDLEQRITEHYKQRGQNTSFAGRYNVYHLLYYEPYKYINEAIAREKEIKGLTREKKMKMINEMNPRLEFLNKEICGCWPPRDLPGRY
ncbi:GIY-YIG nuclease family protein [Flavisolibacter ginsengisoli]|jgi:putative endonuclease|uniref:Putative endonuclease n=1 Tax=Flavisolibacter ginsengisoli DSM 18119 TaxID=1121884 RepID=A0A1M5FQX1_9BACT|nr:GIY-YIG nuclease family protein [Flavisolibacter ginsengisoli]SHF93950.1 putative endonuclease [Flavisolibacter ginsengisoli DSM 18119]